MLIENNSFPSDRRMCHFARMLRDAGYKVSVICPRGKGADEAGFELCNGVSVYRYPAWFPEGGKFGYVLEFLWALICMTIWSLFVWAREGFDIIHCANPPDLLFLVACLYKPLGKKFIYDQHDLCPELYQSKFDRQDLVSRALLFFERRSYRNADLVIVTNQSYRDIARQRGGVGEERSVIARNGVDIRRWHRRPPRPELKGGFAYMAAYVGVMSKQDGVDRAVYAAHHIVHTFGRRDVQFILVGKGECWHSLQKLSEELGVTEYVQFVGHISDDLLLDYFSTSDVGIGPDPPDPMNSHSTMTKIMEYMACELPIVSFDLLETRRSAGDAAVYVEKDDPKMLAQALLDLLDDPVRRERMGRIGLQRTIDLVGLDRSRDALLEGYGRLGCKPVANDAPSKLKARSLATSPFEKQ